MQNSQILRSSINKLIIASDFENTDVVRIQTTAFSSAGDVFTVERKILSPSFVLTQRDEEELNPEISTSYPFKIVPPKDIDGATILLSQTIETPVTASQNYYTPMYYQRYNTNVLRLIDKNFTELSEQFSELEE